LDVLFRISKYRDAAASSRSTFEIDCRRLRNLDIDQHHAVRAPFG